MLKREWRTLHEEELHVLYFSDDKIKETETGRECSTYGGGAYWVLVRRPGGRRTEE
jgi:hypothetical protein